MLFSSIVFLFYFFPLLLIVYYLTPKQGRNYVLLFSSIIFYAWGGVSYSSILILSIIFNFVFVKQIEKRNKHSKNWLYVGLFFNISLIIIFKYLDFFIGNLNDIGFIFNDNFKTISYAKIILPLGISFFTFQQISLLWDIYRNPNNEKTKFIETALYISFFPQLIAGPIIRYNDIILQIKNRKESVELIYEGIVRFVIGLFKKIIIANSCAIIADSIIDGVNTEITTPIAWLGIIAYSFQILFDFSGYSDMAIGLGKIFGFRILENFNYPYISKSIQEFWRRWHISLSHWFKDYVYIPLGGNRNGELKTYRNLIIVFLLTGFWHGPTWSFIFWGVFHGLFLIIERIALGKLLDRIPPFLSWTYTFLVVIIGWVYFRVEDFYEANLYVAKLFGYGKQGDYILLNYLNLENILVLALAFTSSIFVFPKKNIFLINENKFSILIFTMKNIFLIIMFLLCISYINSGSYNPFIYFRF